MFRSVCVPHGVSTVRGRGGAAPEAGVHGVAKEDERRTKRNMPVESSPAPRSLCQVNHELRRRDMT